MALLELNRNPSPRELRWFAGLWFPAFCAMLGLPLWRRFHYPEAAIAICGIAALLAVIGLLLPRVIRPVYTTLVWITFPLGWLFSHVLLFVMYFLVITPVGFVIRLFHDPMLRRFDRERGSYWVECTPRRRDSYTRQL